MTFMPALPNVGTPLQGFNENKTMLFIDIFDDPPTAKIVDPANREVCTADIESFYRDQSTKLAQLLRNNYSQTQTWFESHKQFPMFDQKKKRQGGF